MTKLKSVGLPRPGGKGTFNPPLFYNRIHVTSVPESNDQGNWMGWKFEMAGSVFDLGEDKGSELYDAAKIMLEAVDSGKVRTADPGGNAAPEDMSVGDNGGGGRRDPDEEMPF